MADSELDRRELILKTKDPVFVVDRELRIVLWNDAAETLLGFKAAEVLGRRCHDVLGCREGSGRLVCHEDCMGTMDRQPHSAVPAHDLRVRTKAGQAIWVQVSTILIPSKRRDLSVLVHLVRDVSRQKEVERIVEQLQTSISRLSVPPKGAAPTAAGPPAGSVDQLTAREGQVLRLLVSGASTQAIAEQLYISLPTVRNHIHKILAKLGVHSRLEAVTLDLRDRLP